MKRVVQFIFNFHSIFNAQDEKRLYLCDGILDNDPKARQPGVFCFLLRRQRVIFRGFVGNENIRPRNVFCQPQEPQIDVRFKGGEVKSGKDFLENGEVVDTSVVGVAGKENSFAAVANEQPF